MDVDKNTLSVQKLSQKETFKNFANFGPICESLCNQKKWNLWFTKVDLHEKKKKKINKQP